MNLLGQNYFSCTISIIHDEEMVIDKEVFSNLLWRRRFCFCNGSHMLSVIGTKNGFPSILPRETVLAHIDDLDCANISIKDLELVLSSKALPVVCVTYYLPCCTYKNCEQILLQQRIWFFWNVVYLLHSRCIKSFYMSNT